MSADTLLPIDALSAIVGAAHVLTGDATDSHARDWAGEHQGTPLAVVRPGSTKEVSAVLKWANRTGTAIVPRGGGTGLTGATAAGGAVLLSMERMRAIREIRPEARSCRRSMTRWPSTI